MVKGFWLSIKAPLLSKHPKRLEVALRDAHGAPYLRTVRRIRRSTSLKATDRHALETDLAARLVRARAVLGQWQGGVREIQEARMMRDPARLREALDRWSFAEDDPEIADARADLERWQTLSVTLPTLLKQAMDNQDMQQLKEVVNELASAPHDIKGSTGAIELLEKYEAHCRALDEATSAGNTRSIRQQLAAWQFRETDPPVLRAKAALQEKEEQSEILRVAIDRQDGVALQEAVRQWRFEKDEQCFKTAKELYDRYERAVAELERLRKESIGFALSELSKAIAAWEFTRDDPKLLAAEAHIESFKEVVQVTLRARDGWALEGLWTNSIKPIAGIRTLCEDVQQMLHEYRAAVKSLRAALSSSSCFEPSPREMLEQQVADWAFADDDPNLEVARLWMQLQTFLEHQNSRLLQIMAQSGCASLVEIALDCTQGLRASCPENSAAASVKATYKEAVQAVGAEVLGVDVMDLQMAVTRASQVDSALDKLRSTTAAMDKASIAELRAIAQPSADVLAVVQMVMHVMGGIDPTIRSPPRDTEWRSCQRMLANASSFIGLLDEVPDYIASGHFSGLRRAEAVQRAIQQTLGAGWSLDIVLGKSAAAGRLYEYMEHLLCFSHCLQGAVEGRRASAQTISYMNPPRRSSLVEDSPTHRAASPLTGVPEGEGEEEQEQEEEEAKPQDEQEKQVDDVKDAHEQNDDSSEGLSNSEDGAASDGAARLLETLSRAEGSIAGSAVLAAAWVIHGGSSSIFETSLDGLRRTLSALHSYHFVGDQVLKKSTEMRVKELLEQRCQLARPHSTSFTRSSHARTSRHHHDICIWVRMADSPNTFAELILDKHKLVHDIRSQFFDVTGIAAAEADFAVFFSAAPMIEDESLCAQGVNDGATLFLVRQPITLLTLAQGILASMVVAAKSQKPMAMMPRTKTMDFGTALQRRTPDVASNLLFGPDSGQEAARGRQASSLMPSQQAAMLDVAHAVVDALQHSKAQEQATGTSEEEADGLPPKLRHSAAGVRLNSQLVKSMQVPLLNIASARRAAALTSNAKKNSGGPPQVKEMFLNLLSVFYLDWVPQSSALSAAWALTQQTCRTMSQVRGMVELVKPFSEVPDGTPDLAGVNKVSAAAAQQLEALAQHGLGFPVAHVECARRALDKAGIALLENPPGPDPGLRLRWAEQAMALQLAPLPHFGRALSSIAGLLVAEELQTPLRVLAGASPPVELVRLVAAAIWVVTPDCQRDSGWVDVRTALQSGEAFVQSLVNWLPLRDADLTRLARAHQLLLEVWDWVADGCGGFKAYGALFAWVSLAVGLSPLLDKAQRLAPLHTAVKQSINRIDRAAPEKRALVQDKAWTSALFLFDGAGDKEAWWWLSLIRTNKNMELPWMEGEDGSVAEEELVWEPQNMDQSQAYLLGEDEDDDLPDVLDLDVQDNSPSHGARTASHPYTDEDGERAIDGSSPNPGTEGEGQGRDSSAEGPSFASDAIDYRSSSATGVEFVETGPTASPDPQQEDVKPEAADEISTQPQADEAVVTVDANDEQGLAFLVSQSGMIFC